MYLCAQTAETDVGLLSALPIQRYAGFDI